MQRRYILYLFTIGIKALSLQGYDLWGLVSSSCNVIAIKTFISRRICPAWQTVTHDSDEIESASSRQNALRENRFRINLDLPITEELQ